MFEKLIKEATYRTEHLHEGASFILHVPQLLPPAEEPPPVVRHAELAAARAERGGTLMRGLWSGHVLHWGLRLYTDIVKYISERYERRSYR